LDSISYNFSESFNFSAAKMSWMASQRDAEPRRTIKSSSPNLYGTACGHYFVAKGQLKHAWLELQVRTHFG
jgi:hypothetical protein